MNVSMGQILKFFQTTVFPWNYWWSRVTASPRKLKVGWCSVFPPIPNGAAMMTLYVVKELLKQKGSDVEVYAIPVKGKIDKRLFRGIKYARLSDALDVVFFFSVEQLLEQRHSKTKCIAWQTLHFFRQEIATEGHLIGALKQADVVLAPTKMAQKEYVDAGLKNVAYVPEGIPVKSSVFSCKKKKKVLFVSRSMYYKGVMPFLDAVSLIVQKHPDVEVYAHLPEDKNSPYLSEIRELLCFTKNNFPLNFSFSKKWLSVSETRVLYEDAEVLVFPSNNEGFGIPLVEAMAAGTICVVSDRAPMNEIVEHAKTGICLNMKKHERYHDIAFPTPESIARAVNDVLAHPEKYEQMRVAAREKVEREYDAKNTANALLQHTRNLVQK